MRAVTCNLRMGQFEAAQVYIDALKKQPGNTAAEASASQTEKDDLLELVNLVRIAS